MNREELKKRVERLENSIKISGLTPSDKGLNFPWMEKIPHQDWGRVLRALAAQFPKKWEDLPYSAVMPPPEEIKAEIRRWWLANINMVEPETKWALWLCAIADIIDHEFEKSCHPEREPILPELESTAVYRRQPLIEPPSFQKAPHLRRKNTTHSNSLAKQ